MPVRRCPPRRLVHLLATRSELLALAFQPTLNPRRDLLQPLLGPQRALPDNPNAPTGLKQRRPVIPVATDIRRELPLPVRPIARRRRCARTPVVPMPETAVHEADRSVAGKNEVRPARKRGIMELVPEASGVQRPAQNQLRPSVPALDSRHDARTSRAVEGVRHSLLGLRPSRRYSVGSVRGYRIAARRSESRLGSCIVVGATNPVGSPEDPTRRQEHPRLVRDLARRV